MGGDYHFTDWAVWKGGEWSGSPDDLVQVRIGDLTDEDKEPVPASYWGIGNVASNWRGVNGQGRISAYRIATPKTGKTEK